MKNSSSFEERREETPEGMPFEAYLFSRKSAWRHEMANQDAETYPFTFEAVREKAPSASGVYTIFTAQRWVYVGESDNIRQSLFRHLSEPSVAMNQFGPLSFSSELAPAAERKALQQALIAEREPAFSTEQMAAA